MGIRAWNRDDESELQLKYKAGNKNVQELAEYFNKSPRSVISKLVNLGVYDKPVKPEKTGRTVKTMLRDIEELLDIEIDGFNLNKKSNLLALVEALEKRLKKEK